MATIIVVNVIIRGICRKLPCMQIVWQLTEYGR